MRAFYVTFVGEPKYDSRWFSTYGRGKITLECMDVDWPKDKTVKVVEKAAYDNLRAALTKALPLLKTYSDPAWTEVAEMVERALSEK